jgi:hypothetical protein
MERKLMGDYRNVHVVPFPVIQIAKMSYSFDGLQYGFNNNSLLEIAFSFGVNEFVLHSYLEVKIQCLQSAKTCIWWRCPKAVPRTLKRCTRHVELSVSYIKWATSAHRGYVRSLACLSLRFDPFDGAVPRCNFWNSSNKHEIQDRHSPAGIQMNFA